MKNNLKDLLKLTGRAIAAIPPVQLCLLAEALKLTESGMYRRVWRNLVTEPGYVDIKIETKKVNSVDEMRTRGEFYPQTREIVLSKFEPKRTEQALIRTIMNVNDVFDITKNHEIGHAKSAKYISSCFLYKNAGKKLQISDEIGRSMQELIEFVYLPEKNKKNLLLYRRDYGCTLVRFHELIVKQEHFRNLDVSDILSDSYKVAFNEFAGESPEILSELAMCAMVEYSFVEDGYKKHTLIRSKFKNIFREVDFYRYPVSYNRALNKVFTLDINGKKVNVLKSLSYAKRKILLAHIDQFARNITK